MYIFIILGFLKLSSIDIFLKNLENFYPFKSSILFSSLISRHVLITKGICLFLEKHRTSELDGPSEII